MAKRRKPGTGYTTKAKSGTWNALYPKRGGGYHVRKGFSTRTLAENWLDSLVVQTAEKLNVGKGQQRVGDWIDRWIERAAKEREWKAKMLADVLYKLGYAKPFLGDQALADVEPDDVDAMLDDLARDLAQTTVRQVRNYLYQVFEAAVKRHYIKFNPVIKPERRKRPKQKEPQRLSAPQVAVLLNAAADTFYSAAWWLLVCCGLRAGEICGLRRTDIDLKRAVLTIAQEVTDVRGVATKDLPKGDKVLSIPFPHALVPRIEAHLRTLTRRAAQGLAKGYWQENQLVFPGRAGRPMNPTSLRHQLKRLTDDTRLPPVTTHMLRHTCGGLLITAGAPENLIGGILRHGPRTITGHYAPPDVEAMRPWVEKIYSAIAGEVEKTRQEQTA